MNYYIINSQNQSEGPYTIDQLREMGINESTKVYAKGLTGWTPASDVQELKEQLFTQAPPIESTVAQPAEETIVYQPEPVQASPMQAAPIQATPMQQKPKSSLTWLWVLLGVFGLFVFAGIGIGVVVLLNQDNKPEETVFTEITTEDEDVVVQQTSAWDEYRWLQTRYVTEADIAGKTSAELCIMRNFIFAYHGYTFQLPEFYNYFSQFPEYQPLYRNVSHELNRIEVANVQFLKNHE